MSDDKLEGYWKRDIRICLEQNEELYLERFQRLPRKKFNFCAAIFGTLWFTYRKMEKEAWIIWTIQITLVQTLMIILTVLASKGVLARLSIVTYLVYALALTQLVFSIILGFEADKIYWKKIKQHLIHCDCYKSDKAAAGDKLISGNQFGISMVPTLIFVFINGCISYFILNYVLFPFFFFEIGLKLI